MNTPTAGASIPPQAAAPTAELPEGVLRGREPIRAELLGLEHLEVRARHVASASARVRIAGGRDLLDRGQGDSRVLHEAHRRLSAAVAAGEILAGEGEWLLDNFHIVADALREVRTDLPPGYYRRLPKLADGPLAGWPRVYWLALELIAHTDSALEEAALTHFIRAYQDETPLTIGELWAVPTMLRQVVVENLGRLAQGMLDGRAIRDEAHGRVKSFLATDTQESTVTDLLAESRADHRCFVAVLESLRGGSVPRARQEQIEGLIRDQGIPIEDWQREERQRQAANQVTVSNCVTTLRLLSAIDWPVFYETASVVDGLLRADPADIYKRQDFLTRDRTRQAVEVLARGSNHDELAICRKVLQLSAESKPKGTLPFVDLPPQCHVGYHLIGDGRTALERKLRYRSEWRPWLYSVIRSHARLIYFGTITAVTAVLLALLGWYATAAGGASWGLVALVVAVTMLPAAEIAVGVINSLVTLVLPPRTLPKLDFAKGIPDECSTFVVIPTLLTSPAGSNALVERLEIHYLSNPDPQLRFALLTDWLDAPSEHMPADESIVQTALDGIAALNRRYAPDGPPKFFLFHRRRLWNPVQNCWMGWERKRGKLSEFNRLLLGERDTTYSVVSADLAELPHARFVITLDSDTQMPRETARRLIGTLAHPLNRPHFDPARRRVMAGYAILQPRISISMPAARRSRFARLLAGSAGIDPYTTATSDVYQDLFGLGSFTGKGIYDVAAFEAANGPAFPENHILSHDLIESNFARCALVSDIELIDDLPARYNAFAKREHRWVRGDWQLLPWLGRRIPVSRDAESSERSALANARAPLRKASASRLTVPNVLPVVERWKVLDNLRRSLTPPALLLFFLLAWTVLPGSPAFWTLVGVAVPFLPLLLNLPTALVRVLWRSSPVVMILRDLGVGLVSTSGQAVLQLSFLAHQAWTLLDAVVRTLVRLYGTRRNLLEWETAAATEGRLGNALPDFFRFMTVAPATAMLAALVVTLTQAAALPAAIPLLLLWLVSPVLAFWASQPLAQAENPLSDAERRAMRRIARKTWDFFERFVTAADNGLPPDNYQEEPKGELAHRTSPTNIGLSLAVNLAAHDFGYISLNRVLDRTELALDTLDRMEKHQGHWFNWYDTRTLKPLEPRYVSTVDSGNLLAGLLVLRQGLLEKARAPIAGPFWLDGLADTLHLAEEALTTDGAVPGVREVLLAVAALLTHTPSEAPVWDDWLKSLSSVLGSLDLSALDDGSDLWRWLERLREQVEERNTEVSRDAPADRARPAGASRLTPPDELASRCEHLADRAARLAAAMDFRPLYNESRHLFSIGLNLTLGRLDASHYDLLASESALTSFLTIARGEAHRRHWFQLGRPVTRVGASLALVSWGGTMFEYLMPRLFLRNHAQTLLAEARHAAVERQIEYGRERGVPWGISESGYNLTDIELNYQYQSFGVPGLGLKRGLERDLVVAPYATVMAVIVRPHEAVANFAALAAEGGEGPFGFYEAIDYTPERVPDDKRRAVVRSYMAHHQGMGFLALANVLLGEPFVRRLHAEAMVKATELLLQERVPWDAPLLHLTEDAAAQSPATKAGAPPVSRKITSPDTARPRTMLISNSSYTVVLTNAGGCRSMFRDLAVTRWREDRTRDFTGQCVYVRDLDSDTLWSAGHLPVCRPPDSYEALFAIDKAEIRRRDGAIETLLEVTVATEHPAEVRRVTVTNHDDVPHAVELTSYVELALAPQRADAAHPAFGKLFLETEYLPGPRALLCRRRPRGENESPLWAVHVAAVDGNTEGEPEFDTDRATFLGRGRSADRPAALDPGVKLAGRTGPVLDPVFSLRRRVRLPAGESANITFTTAVAHSRAEAEALADRYQLPPAATRAFELAWAHGPVELHHLGLSDEDAHLFQRLAGHLLISSPKPTGLSSAAPRLPAISGPEGLWRLGISGDWPIVLLLVDEGEHFDLLRQLLAAHTYWRHNGLRTDLIVLNERATAYYDEFFQQLQRAVRNSPARDFLDRAGGVYIRQGDSLAEDDRALLREAARVILTGRDGRLEAQLERPEALPEPPATWAPSLSEAPTNGHPPPPAARPTKLLFDNGYGGFSLDGREYVIPVRGGPKTTHHSPRTTHQHCPPAPWVNVLANPMFGCLASDGGLGATWGGNSQTNRLTPWSNDPVLDPPSEIVYVRDESNGDFWTPTPLPLGQADVRVRHGAGYTVYEQTTHHLAHEMTVFVAAEEPLKFVCVKLTNLGNRRRHLSATFYADWVLGGERGETSGHVVTEIDSTSGAIYARNPYRADFAGQIAFADVLQRPRTVTADRTEFLGRNRSTAHPAAMERQSLSGRAGPGLDPCAALQVLVDIDPGAEREVVFVLGEAADPVAARALLQRCREPGRVHDMLAAVRQFWNDLCGAVQVQTPNAALDLLLNRWLPYQVLACRVWGRTAFYQSSGAFGFRDQLQDSLALLYAAPHRTREQLLRSASRQFTEGDVQHWWHPPGGAGVRTRCSDDRLWLPYAALRYLAVTGDTALLDEPAPFLQAAPLPPGQDDSYGRPAESGSASFYEHCARAIDVSLEVGAHGLPLIGSCDWNDGYNSVGDDGKGESVWLAWFQLAILPEFAKLAESRGDSERAKRWSDHADRIRRAAEEHAWDGAWYRRAYYDDGTPLGSAADAECRIDSLAQSWAVMCGGADPGRTTQAMEAVWEQLVRPWDHEILLFTPPFDRGRPYPGYVAGYLPGVRENGGQYTHGSTWVIEAFARLGQGERAVELLDVLNPILASATPEAARRYAVEPYVLAGDVYGPPAPAGRGGWTWYTGSAAWYYRIALETVLGLQVRGDKLTLRPVIPGAWKGFSIRLRHRSATYIVTVERGSESPAAGAVWVDGEQLQGDVVEMRDDGREHATKFVLNS